MEAQHRQMDYMRRRMGTATAWQPVGGTDGQPLYVPVPQAPYPRPWDKNPQYVYKPAKYIGFQKGDALDRQEACHRQHVRRGGRPPRFSSLQ